MAIELKVPAAGESILEVQIGEWLKREGDAVERDEIVVAIETDKASLELAAPVSGRLGKILKEVGETATVGEVIGSIDEGVDGERRDARAVVVPAAAAAPSAAPERVMPAARRALHDAGLPLSAVSPSGPGGRLLKEDVERAAAPRTEPGSRSGTRPERLVPMSLMRKRIAARLGEARREAALLTTFNEIDMSAVIALRQEYKALFAERHQVKLGFMSFFVKAAVAALGEEPALNAEIRGEQIAYRDYYDIGVAVGSGRGLVVPVLRDADRMSFADVEKAIADLAARAQASKLTVEELQGGTFTISNGGIYGSLLSTPIVNYPQSGILGLHAIQERPVAIKGEVVIRPMMYVAVTYDHRLIDGREAVTFLVRIKQAIEDPARLLLEV